MKIKNINNEVKNIGLLLKHDPENNVLNGSLDVKKLDYSIESLKEVDRYIEKVRKKRKELSEEDIKKLILRVGTYLGEVIRKHEPKNIVWLDYKEALKHSKDMSKTVDKDMTTNRVLYNIDKESVWFPLGKVYKFIYFGRGDNLTSFAKVMLTY